MAETTASCIFDISLQGHELEKRLSVIKLPIKVKIIPTPERRLV
jgi:hypothetical protein